MADIVKAAQQALEALEADNGKLWPSDKRTAAYFNLRRAALAQQAEQVQRKPLTEKEMYAVEEEARKSFRQSQRGVRGQQITYWDGLTPWLIRAVEAAHGIKEAE